MLSQLIENHRKNITNDVHLDVLKSATASAFFSAEKGLSPEEICRNAIGASMRSLFDSIILGPIIKTVLSGQSESVHDCALLSVNLLTDYTLRGCVDIRNVPMKDLPWPEILLHVIIFVNSPRELVYVHLFS